MHPSDLTGSESHSLEPAAHMLRGRTGMLALAERMPYLCHVNEVAQSRGCAYLLESPGSGSQSVDRSQSRKLQFRSEHCSSHAIPEAGCLSL